MKYDYLIIGAGLFGAIFAKEASEKGYKCLVIDKRDHIGGNLFCKNREDIQVHQYGAHIFHTSNKTVWSYINTILDFNHYINSPIANYKGELFNLPFNMNTFYRLWGTISPKEAMLKIQEQRAEASGKEPQNLEEQAVSLVGKDVYLKLIKGYTEKQWGRDAKDLPAFIIKRIPVRFTYDNNYFDDRYQGIPIGGYNTLFEKCFEKCDVLLNTDFFKNKQLIHDAKKILFTGMIDQYYDYCFGALEYRSLKFEHQLLDIENYQGNAVVNYTDRETPYTRIIEHKHFEFGKQPKTVITKEYPANWADNSEPYYPVNDDRNNLLASKYKNLASKEESVIFGGRLADYKYYDMDDVIENALSLTQREL